VRVQVIGFCQVAFEAQGVFAYQQDADLMNWSSGVWLDLDDETLQQARTHDGSFILVEGRFSAKTRGHMGVWAGALSQISRIEPALSRAEVRPRMREVAEAPHVPRVVVEPTRAVFRSAGDVSVWVTIENGEPDCRPLFVDPVFSAFGSPRRPHTKLTLEVSREDGRRVEMEGRMEPQFARLALHELLLLECDTSFGRRVSLAKEPWRFGLGPGKYRIRAMIEIFVGSFVRNHALGKDLQRLWRLHPDALGTILRDVVAESAESTLEIPAEAGGEHREDSE
jgi:hypothetical protein